MIRSENTEDQLGEDTPVLTIAVPTFNRSERLSRQLQSLVPQLSRRGTDVEVVVLDNHSSDNTPDVVAQAQSSLRSLKSFRHQRNLGLIGNYRSAFEIAKGRYVWVLGDDDPLEPGAVEAVCKAVERPGAPPLIHLNLSQVNGITGERYTQSYYASELHQEGRNGEELTELFTSYDHSPWLWISGSVLRVEDARSVLGKMQGTRNFALPFLVNVTLASEGGWVLLRGPLITMETHATSWAADFYRRIYGIDFPLALRWLRGRGIDLSPIPQFSEILRRRWRMLIGAARQRRRKIIQDYREARI